MDWKPSVKSMLEKGEDPKQYLIELCRPSCQSKQQRLERCEATLKSIGSADPELSCMYPLRDWVTCLDGCVQPKIHSQLVGNEKGFIN